MPETNEKLAKQRDQLITIVLTMCARLDTMAPRADLSGIDSMREIVRDEVRHARLFVKAIRNER